MLFFYVCLLYSTSTLATFSLNIVRDRFTTAGSCGLRKMQSFQFQNLDSNFTKQVFFLIPTLSYSVKEIDVGGFGQIYYRYAIDIVPKEQVVS
jgi:hypothetical protein